MKHKLSTKKTRVERYVSNIEDSDSCKHNRKDKKVYENDSDI